MDSSQPIIPVLDLMIGQVVLAQGGKRDDYRPVNSKLTHSSQPLDVAKAIQQQTGCSTMYLADIDSFAGAEPNWRVYQELLDFGFSLWIDADWMRFGHVERIADALNEVDCLKVIVSSETLKSLDQIETVARLNERGIEPIFSLDQKAEVVLSKSPELTRISPLEWILRATSYGINRLIVLDLERVGTMCGSADTDSTNLLFQEIRAELPQIDLTSGGGVRSVEDAAVLLKSGCNHVLVASAIHECRFTHHDVARLENLTCR